MNIKDGARVVCCLLVSALAWVLPAAGQVELDVRMPDGTAVLVQLAQNQDIQLQDELTGTVYRLRLEEGAEAGSRVGLLLLDGQDQLVQRVELAGGERTTAGRDGQFIEIARPEASQAVRNERPDADSGMVRLEIDWGLGDTPAVALAMPGEPVQLSRGEAVLRATVAGGLPGSLTEVVIERAGRSARYALPLGARLSVPAVGDVPAMALSATAHTPNPGQAYTVATSDALIGLCITLQDGESIRGVVQEGELFRLSTGEEGPVLGLSAHHDAQADSVSLQVFEIHFLGNGREGLEHLQAFESTADAGVRLDVDGAVADVRATRLQPNAESPDKASICWLGCGTWTACGCAVSCNGTSCCVGDCCDGDGSGPFQQSP